MTSIQINSFGSTTISIFFTFNNLGYDDTDVMANLYRKTVNTIFRIYIQHFYTLDYIKELSNLMEHAIKPTLVKHQTYAMNKAKIFSMFRAKY